MILDRIRESFCRALCPHHADPTIQASDARLERAEKLHIMTARDAAMETQKTGRQVGYMRTVANSAVDRLRHERTEVEGTGKS